MDKNELMLFLVENAEYSEQQVANMTNTELMDHWLEYYGICGWMDDIKDVVCAAFGVNLED
jgi:hypothetical protein|nr:MAG TPA_asm: hypothetical protein [Caudoviricetes sp.]